MIAMTSMVFFHTMGVNGKRQLFGYQYYSKINSYSVGTT